jgi:ubiquinone/menaquinone biosynthesis C-methylase UbiE
MGVGDSMLIEEVRMQEVSESDQGSHLYSWFNGANLFRVHELERRILLLLQRSGFQSLREKKILEVGCGSGYWLREFAKWGGSPHNMVGIDLVPARTQEARQLCPQGMILERGNAAELTFPESAFDLVLQFTVFSSILDFATRQKAASEMLRVVKPDGLIIWYDFFVRKPGNHAVRAITRAEIYRLFPRCLIDLHRISLAPPLARVLAPYSWLACYLLERSRLLNAHYLGVIRKS